MAGHRSKIDDLDPRIRAEVDRLLADGRFTIDQVVAHLRSLGVDDVSRSSVGRYKKRFDRVAAKLRESREMAEALVREIGPAAVEGKTGRLLVEILQNVTFNHLVGRAEAEDAEDSAQDLYFLGRAIKEMAQAQKLDVEREARIKRDFADRAAAAAGAEARRRGLSAEAVEEIQKKILGLAG